MTFATCRIIFGLIYNNKIFFPQDKVEPVVKPVVQAEVLQERTAIPVAEETKPMMVPELIMSESDKKEEKLDKPEEPMVEMPEKIKELEKPPQ